jgi:hypothetical protein
MNFEEKSRQHSAGSKDNSLDQGIKKVAVYREGNLRPQIFPVTAVSPAWRNVRIGI